jgi:hypothetical protein
VELSLHAGVTAVVLLSLHVAVAVYVPVLFSFTDEGPEIDRAVKFGITQGYGEARPDSSPVLRTVFAVK